MIEKDLENELCKRLNSGKNGLQSLRETSIANTENDIVSIYDLVGENQFELVQDNTDWNPLPNDLYDLMHGKVPDIVLRSSMTGKNRIYIEVKLSADLGAESEVAYSQVVRYFLHLLATTRRFDGGIKTDIRRAMLLAAPSSWFKKPKNSRMWGYFISTYRPIATEFDITLGEIHLE